MYCLKRFNRPDVGHFFESYIVFMLVPVSRNPIGSRNDYIGIGSRELMEKAELSMVIYSLDHHDLLLMVKMTKEMLELVDVVQLSLVLHLFECFYPL